MQYLYEISIKELEKKQCEKLFSYLKNKNLEVFKTEEKLIIKSDDFYFLRKLDKMIKALKVGFNFKFCRKIIEGDYELIEIDVKRAADKKINHLKRIMGRIIGKDGKSIKKIEMLSKSEIIIKGRFVYILGDKISVEAAYEGLNLLIEGAPHKRAFERITSTRRHLNTKEKELQFYLDFT